MRMVVAADHGGLELKQPLLQALENAGHQAVDLGAHQFDADDDYPDYARLVGHAIQQGQAQRGIVLCGSGVGAAVAACKLQGIRAAVCHDVYSAHQGVEHDDMNVLCLGARVIGPALAIELALAFAGAQFQPLPRYQRRLDKVLALERALNSEL